MRKIAVKELLNIIPANAYSCSKSAKLRPLLGFCFQEWEFLAYIIPL